MQDRIAADSIQVGDHIDLDNGDEPGGEPRVVSSVEESGVKVLVSFADGEPGADFMAEETVWRVGREYETTL